MIRDQLVKRALMHNDFKMIAQLTVDLNDEVFALYSKAWSESAREAAAEARRGGRKDKGEGTEGKAGKEPGPSAKEGAAATGIKPEKWTSKDGWNTAEIKVEGDKLHYRDYNESKAEGEKLSATRIGDKYKIDSKNDLGAFSELEVGQTYPAEKVEKIVKENYEGTKKAYA